MAGNRFHQLTRDVARLDCDVAYALALAGVGRGVDPTDLALSILKDGITPQMYAEYGLRIEGNMLYADHAVMGVRSGEDWTGAFEFGGFQNDALTEGP